MVNTMKLKVIGAVCLFFAALNIAFFISLGHAYNLAAAVFVAGCGIYALVTADNIDRMDKWDKWDK